MKRTTVNLPDRIERGRAQREDRHLGADRRNPGVRGDSITALVDAGPIYAYVDADDRHHHACLTLLREYRGRLIVPTLVITEVCYLIGTRLGAAAEVRFLGDLAAGEFGVEPVGAGDWLRIAELVHGYRDQMLGTVDASVVATEGRLGVTTIMTLDRPHLSLASPFTHPPSRSSR